MSRLDLRLPRARGFPCPACGHDLRGESLYGRCPKCGAEVLGIFLEARTDTPRGYQVAALRMHRVYLRAIARSIGYPRSAAEFVSDAIGFAPTRWRKPVDARAICQGVGVVARKTFRDAADAREMLLHWKLARSEDVGALTMALLDHGLVKAPGVTSAREFDGVFVTERWFG